MKKIFELLLTSFFFFSLTLPCYAGMATVSDRHDVQVFIKQMVKQYNFSGPQLKKLFDQVKIRNDIITSMSRPKEANPWYRYRAYFVTQKKIDDGVIFWQQHANALQTAHVKYGVPPALIVAIIGVETNYGKFLGNYRVIDALSTFAFTPSPRRNFFRNELKEFLLLTREQSLNPLTVTGSYAGAIGVPQFMPSSYRNYAVSSTGSSKIDLLNNRADAIESVANYFKTHGWQPNQPIAIPAAVSGRRYNQLINRGFRPKLTLSELAQNGVKPAQRLDIDNKAILFRLQEPKNFEYWLGFNNFYVITTYNPNTHYAMAVYQLGISIQKKYRKT